MKWLMVLAIGAALQDADYRFPAPDGWRTERIEFPIPFAKDLDYKGFEDLRFAPGMFKPEAPDYFSYAFVFWIDGPMSFEPPSIEKDLLKYYKGLCGAVAKSRKLDIDLSKIAVQVKKLDKKGKLGGEEADRFEATIEMVDVFVTGKPLTLRLECWGRAAGTAKRSCFLAIASPKEKSEAVWETLHKIQVDFSTPK
jgi:hypothetical protein